MSIDYIRVLHVVPRVVLRSSAHVVARTKDGDHIVSWWRSSSAAFWGFGNPGVDFFVVLPPGLPPVTH